MLLDNAEHLLPDVADHLVQLLQACPAVTALVTSFICWGCKPSSFGG
ncbi:MAG: hypothetical protein R3E79_62030 [Caldilineaceae bacterium]